MKTLANIVIIALGTSLALSLAGCNLIEDTLGLTPPPGALGLELQAPKNKQISVSVTGQTFSDQFSDDGTGFVTRLSLKPGVYTISAQALPGFSAQVSVTQKNGNITQVGSQSVTISSNAVSSARVSYVVLP